MSYKTKLQAELKIVTHDLKRAKNEAKEKLAKKRLQLLKELNFCYTGEEDIDVQLCENGIESDITNSSVG